MEINLSFEGDNDLSYEDHDSRISYPFRQVDWHRIIKGKYSPWPVIRRIWTPPSHGGSYNLEQPRQEEEDPEPEKTSISQDSEAPLNVNTNANSRGDCLAYVELNELTKDSNQEDYWQETGRWVGYEESYSSDSGTWGSAHISYLTFKSLIHLRKMMISGVTLLDQDANSLADIAETLVAELASKKEIRAASRDHLLRTLLKKRSQHEQKLTPSSEIEMKSYSVTKMRDTSSRVEASIVLSGAVDILQKPTVAFVRLKEAVIMESVLESSVPVRFVFVLVGPSQSGIDYHESGRAMAVLMADRVFNIAAFLAKSDTDLTDAMADFMDCSIVIPPTEIQNESMLASMISFQKTMLRQRLRPSDTRLLFDIGRGPKADDVPKEDPLARTGRPFGGLVKDIKRRYRHYLSDFTDALNLQVLATIIFIYFAALSPAITFGGLLAEKTKNMMGVSELMISTSIQGVIFCLFAAQPILVIGFSGPLLVFDGAFFTFCERIGIEYIVGRVWVGFWLVIIVLILIAVEGSFLVRFITRFTQEIFSILISLIFIIETFSKLIQIFQDHPLTLNYKHLNDTLENPFYHFDQPVSQYNRTNQTFPDKQSRAYPNTALLSMCLMFGCFFIAYFFRQFKNGHFLPGPVRRMIGDFGVPIALFIMVVADICIKDTYTKKLVVPKGLEVSNPGERPWFIHPLGIKKMFPIWMIFACIVPAMLVFILIFLETQITTLLVSKPERKMAKGSGFHLDLLLIVAMGGIGALFGVPWLSATTVRSVTHANALTIMTKGPKPEIKKVIEQRVSGILVAALVGVSILMAPILNLIPISALFGIFLYMGVTSLSGIQLWDRVLLLITPKKYFPPDAYATRVKPWRMHLFTFIQITCLGVLWVVKTTENFSLALPFVLILTVPLRILMTGRLFSIQEMKCLDSDDVKVTLEEDPGEDVYTESPLA